MLVLLGNFPGLRSVYISRVDLVPVEGSTNVFIESIKELLFTSVPDYLTVSILRLCEGYNKDPSKNMCTPPSLGFQYSSSEELLGTIESQIPPSLHSKLAGIQGGVFIVSVILCFLLLCFYVFHIFAERRRLLGWCWILLCLILTALALLFAAATFAIQMYVHNLIKSSLSDIQASFLGSLFSEFVQLVIKTGASVWLSLVSLILLFLVFVLLCISMCCINRTRRRDTAQTTNNQQEMSSV
ncbi:hypothetical protein RMATCC62417_05949 [Rhizopus microsporus]|nr:hypothetical protein RMATCC62417_05949 [Rhizopus microsporus]